MTRWELAYIAIPCTISATLVGYAFFVDTQWILTVPGAPCCNFQTILLAIIRSLAGVVLAGITPAFFAQDWLRSQPRPNHRHLLIRIVVAILVCAATYPLFQLGSSVFLHLIA